MLTGLLLTAVYGLVWGVLWGGLDAICIIKGFLATNDPIPSVIRQFLTMLVASFITGLLLGGGSSLIAVIIAVIVSIYARPWVMARWRW
jgi:hypothetical protein